MGFKDVYSFYRSEEWEKFRNQLILERVNDEGYVICGDCGKPIINKYDIIAHHKIELNEQNVFDYNISLNPENIELIHFRCHNIRHQRFDGFKQEVFLVYGSPCSGKSTWVNNIANDDDLIVDIDKIWECICLSDKYKKPNRLKANAFGVRNALIEQIKTRTGMWKNAYYISTMPLRSDRDRICDLLRATPIFIEETKEICLERAKTPEWKSFVEEWFENYTE